MALLRKNFGAAFENMNLIIKVCDENVQVRQNLLSLLALPFANRQMLMEQWLESMKKSHVAENLIHAMGLLQDEDLAKALLKELEEMNG